MMPEAFPIHRLDIARIPAALSLSAEAEWNQVEADWHLMIGQGDSFGISTEDGQLVATGLTVLYSGKFGWISMILVTAAFRRRGFATRLMSACMGTLQDKGVTPALDASPEGRQVYLHLGFEDVYRTTRLFSANGRTAVGKRPDAASAGIRSLTVEDLSAVEDYDRALYGADRSYMLTHLRDRLPDVAFLCHRAGRVRGFVLARDGRTCAQIGPLMADDGETALALLQHALCVIPGPVCLDVGDHHEGLRAWLNARGFSPVTRFVRMIHRRKEPYDDPERVFVIAGPELG